MLLWDLSVINGSLGENENIFIYSAIASAFQPSEKSPEIPKW